MIIYDEMIAKMRENGITSYTIKGNAEKESYMSQGSYTRMKNNKGYIGLELIEKLLNSMKINRVELIRDGDNFRFSFPDDKE